VLLADKLNVFVPVWRRFTGNRFTGNRFMDPHHRPGDRGTRLDAWKAVHRVDSGKTVAA
tara:strand:- start:362 stop:538 length:177 start_codon:yes stop_codon:yes gene_type:complete